MKIKLLKRAPIQGVLQDVGTVHTVEDVEGIHLISRGIAKETAPEPKKKKEKVGE